jgi:hypothetical protein
MPDNPETWYDYSRVEAALNKQALALVTLKRAIDLSNARLAKTSNAFNIKKDAITNQNFAALRGNQEFLRLVAQ